MERKCEHNPGLIDCDRKTCALCGWEPKEAERRLREIETKGLRRDERGVGFFAVRTVIHGGSAAI